uniref:Uncharacterized protein n=1 Tax=Chromera velia CCMP2878 TaxID=1169474 RepID=A0A0G4F8X8_9ALVE|eukprot:Cvel_2982.t1-p1 / transcript=Cvel_2982.t1 / gene=Cvel_2982 / organism=Chromera_velia_CCMP2878 / gene_product=hypothetical protein / transcript_product=hypothetical protein / location=Cvel_scaffold118:86061-87195(+) / protein_length=214 / sequence_SO=supercontig / SO=protein_coding / is_pseudo=false
MALPVSSFDEKGRFIKPRSKAAKRLTCPVQFSSSAPAGTGGPLVEKQGDSSLWPRPLESRGASGSVSTQQPETEGREREDCVGLHGGDGGLGIEDSDDEGILHDSACQYDLDLTDGLEGLAVDDDDDEDEEGQSEAEGEGVGWGLDKALLQHVSVASATSPCGSASSAGKRATAFSFYSDSLSTSPLLSHCLNQVRKESQTAAAASTAGNPEGL